jgi:hypothetical protein
MVKSREKMCVIFQRGQMTRRGVTERTVIFLNDCPLTNTFHLWKRLQILKDDRYLIIGCQCS